LTDFLCSSWPVLCDKNRVKGILDFRVFGFTLDNVQTLASINFKCVFGFMVGSIEIDFVSYDFSQNIHIWSAFWFLGFFLSYFVFKSWFNQQ